MKKYGNCNKCYVGYDGGCSMKDFWKSVGEESHHECKSYISKDRYEERWSRYPPCKGGTTESDLD